MPPHLTHKNPKHQKTSFKATPDTKHDQKSPPTRSQVTTENDSDDDDELLMAAAQWAQSSQTTTTSTVQQKKQKQSSPARENHETRNTVSSQPLPASTTNKFSLHITNIPFDATSMDIRKHFATECSIESLRLVYDRAADGISKQFRGVAFLDVNDQRSFDYALQKLHNSKLLGRPINVRPTRTRHELSQIVQVTREKVRDKIHRMLKKRQHDDKDDKNDRKNDKRNDKKHKSSDRNAKKGKTSTSKPKQSKQERSRRAAILRHGKGGKKL